MTKRLKSLMVVALMAVCSPLFAQKVSVQAPRVVALGEQFSVVFSVEGSKVKGFDWEAGEDFNLIWGPVTGVSTSYVNTNGKSSTTVIHTYSYVLEAKSEGTFVIPPAKASIAGKEYSSPETSIEVIKSSQPSPTRGGNMQQQQGGAEENSTDDVFMSLSLNKTKAVVGEPITATLKLYTNVDLNGVENPQFPIFNGFWSQETDSPVNLTFQRENVGGKLYNSALLRRYVLIPQQSGKLTVDPAEMVAVVIERNSPRGGASIFDSFFDNYRTVRKRIRTDAVTVDVSPLPSGAPASFKGGVGRFSMNVEVGKDTLNTHEAATLTVTISGNGNLSLIEPPAVKFPSDFEHYDVKVSDTGGKAGTSGTRKYEFPFIPRTSGTFDIPSVEYSYYDISKGRYVTLESGPIRMVVVQGEESGASVYSPGVNRQSVKNLNEDIRFIATGDPGLHRAGRFFVATPLFFVILACIIVLSVASLAVGRKLIRRNSDVAAVRNRKATKMALKRLKAAAEYLKGGMYSAFYEELHKALLGYISDKLAMEAVDMSKENIASGLVAHGVDEDICNACLALIDACEYARYSPEGGDDAMQNHYNEAVRVISTMDGMIKAKKDNKKDSLMKGKVLTLSALVFMLIGGGQSIARDSTDVKSLWSGANADYEAGDWASAIEKYDAVLAAGYESDKLYYNLANAYYKSGSISRSILNYERALKLNPSFDDARNNLDMVAQLTVDRIEKVPDFILKTWTEDIGRALSSDGWAVLFLSLFASAAVSLLLSDFIRSRAARIVLFIAGIVLVILSLLSITASLERRADYMSEDSAIVVSAVSSVRSSPSDENTTSLFVLHEGTKVEILEYLGDWSKIEIADGRQGWMASRDMEVI